MIFLELNIVTLLLSLLSVVSARPQQLDTENSASEMRNGRYVPQLYGADRGRYTPDDSGKYRHIFLPYDGGYGDRGLKYEPDDRGRFRLPPVPFALGPRDHLRFMIDFNYNNSGWQIIQFEWKRDGEDTNRFNFLHENQLFQSHDMSAPSGASVSAESGSAVGGDATDTNTNTYPDTVTNTDINTDTAEAVTPVDDSDDAGASVGANAGETESYRTPATYYGPSIPASNNVHVIAKYAGNMPYNVSYTRQDEQDTGLKDTIREVLEYIESYILPTLTYH